MLEVLLVVYAALLGAVVGSFLNVCIYRLPEGLSVVRPRSRCPECSTPIGWRDNLPVVSWMLLRGRCRNCGIGISAQYPLVEITTAVLWVAAFLRFGLSWPALSMALFFTLLLGIALTDARTYTIPDEFTLGGLALGLLLSMFPGTPGFLTAAGGAALGFVLLYLVAVLGEWAFKKPAMGGGDIKMMAMVGAFLGPVGALLTIFLGALAGTLIFGPISARTGRLVPFGIFLAVGAALTHAWGDALLRWYQATLLGG
jgi:leader peptidase (prepilin peptidase) / N-methyltransferase